jgi:hypothetical protein
MTVEARSQYRYLQEQQRPLAISTVVAVPPGLTIVGVACQQRQSEGDGGDQVWLRRTRNGGRKSWHGTVSALVTGSRSAN